MKKTDNFFLIHNYNTVPEELLSYCKDYMIYDASGPEIRKSLQDRAIKYVPVSNTGHNITTYFQYFWEHYDSLPEVICLLKGNILGRHCSIEYFNKVYDNKFFTYLYEDRTIVDKLSKKEGREVRGAYLLSENHYLELNNSWYVKSENHPHRYFDNVDRLLLFIYKEPVIPKFMMFSPGACYIVRREQILRNSREFYKNLNSLMNYGLQPSFPSEAHQVERILPIIFETSYEVNEWMNEEEKFWDYLKREREITVQNDEIRKQEAEYSLTFAGKIKGYIKKAQAKWR